MANDFFPILYLLWNCTYSNSLTWTYLVDFLIFWFRAK